LRILRREIREKVFKFSVDLAHVFIHFASNSNPETTRVPATLKVAGARLLIPEAPITEHRHHWGRRRTPTLGILFRNLI